jgi:predicted ribosome quality control (RQC) complex YloA/Tae2 family protein
VLSLAELERAARVAGARLAGHRLQEAVQPDGERVVLSFYGGGQVAGGRSHLCLCAGEKTARLSLVARPPRALPAPPAFTQYLRAHVVGARLLSLSLRGGDRQVALELETREGRATLLLQILGRRSNLYLLDAAQNVVAALRALSATRPELALGQPWRAPISPPPRRGEDRFAALPDAELLEAIEASYAQLEAQGASESLAQRIEQALRREERRLARKLEKIAAELEAAQAAARLARQGELLKGALGRVERGAARVVVRDFETGEDVEIALDPALGPAENLDAVFRRARKGVRRLTRGGAQDEAVRAAHRELEALLAELDAAQGDAERLRALAERPPLRALLERHAPAAPAPGRRRAGPRATVLLAGRELPRRLVPRRYRTAGELEIWVGRSDEANDFLTLRLARGKDLFFHLDGAPGSHVILRTGGRSDPPAEALLDACELAVHFSKAKAAGRADVHVVPIANVGKPRGAKPGLVSVHGGRTVHLRREPARLARVLAARVEDEGD